MALSTSILLVSFGSSDRKHTQRLEKLLCHSFDIKNCAFTDSTSAPVKEKRYRVVLSRLAHLLSVPAIGLIVWLHRVLRFFYFKRNDQNFLSDSIQNYFDNERSLISLTLHLNRTLRQQKVRVIRANQVINAAMEEKVDCVLLPEDSHFYSSGIIITRLQELGIKVGIVDFTIGKEEEFKTARNLLVPDRDFLPHLIFAKLLLNSSARTRWIKTKEFINCFPGSLETASHNSFTPAFSSGLADFYLTSDEKEFVYLKSLASTKALVCLIEPIEVSLSRINTRSTTERNVFGLFLPPNQLTDPAVMSRISSVWGDDYENIILKILDDVQSICLSTENIVVFPHPRTYLSNPLLIDKISAKHTVSDDFADYLANMRLALVFSSSVFSALLAANIKVFNLDLYNYDYAGVFPVSNRNFVSVKEIREILDHSREPEPSTVKSSVLKSSVTEFLELNL